VSWLKITALIISSPLLVYSSVSLLVAAQAGDRNPLHLAPHHATVSVADWDKECNWYQRVLGFEQLQQPKVTPERKICYLNIPGYRLDVLWQKGSMKNSATMGSAGQGWLNVEFSSSDIDTVYKYLNDHGIEVKVDRGNDGSLQHLKFQDPEGNEIGIIKP
jgi:catechol 2,3-dioxygenase-like lactoylglutathione lyase family enzyme